MERMRRKTIDGLKAVLRLLAFWGEVSIDRLGPLAKLREQHLLMLLQSGLVCATPYSFLASPRMLRFMPFTESEDVLRKTGLQKTEWVDTQAWATFHERAFSQPVPKAFANLGYDYVYTPIPDAIYEDVITRPVWCVPPISESVDLAEWDPWVIIGLSVFVQGKHFVHGLLVIDEPNSGVAAIRRAIWGSPFYWVALQLLILSDQETGSAYDWKIALDCPTILHRPLESPGTLPISLDGRYVCDLSDVVDEILESFRWVWVNRPNEPAKRQYALLAVLRVLAGVDVLERRPGGRLGLTDSFRKQLFLNTSSHREQYLQSRNARERIREIIIRKSGESHA